MRLFDFIKNNFLKKQSVKTGNHLVDFYNRIDEDSRLLSKHGRIEFLTTVKYIEKYLSDGMRIIEIGAATGRYSHYFAQKGFEVDAVELVEHNIDIFKANTKPGEKVNIRQGNALDLSDYADNTYTLKLQVAALCKLYSCSSTDFISTPPRKRKNITRSRNTNIKCTTDFEKFCLCTGLRRREITALRGSALIIENGQYYIHVKNGKGGRERLAEICGTKEEIDFVIDKMKKAEDKKVFSKIPYIDIHAMRAIYASRIYNKYARQKSEYKNERLIMYHNRVIKTYNSKNIDIKNNLEYYDYSPQTGYTLKPGYKDVRTAYFCRQDKKHICYDRLALLKCSQNLGHNRACIVADHYLWNE